MALRGVYELDVDPDGRFAAFQRQFAQHQDDMRSAHRQNTTYGSGVTNYFKQFSSELNNLSRRSIQSAKDEKAAMEAVSAETRRAATWQGQLANFASRGAREMRDMVRSTKGIATNIAEGTRWLLRWSGLGAAIASVAGPPLLASSMANRRYTALGLGVDTGQLQAAQLAYGRFFDPNSVLSNVAGAQQDWSRRWAFSALGFSQADVSRMSPGQLTADMAIRAKQLWDSGDQSQQFAQAHGLLEFYSMEDLRRLHGQSLQSLQTARTQYDAYSRELNVPDRDQQAWTDFYFQLRRAGDRIENTFIEGLAPLAPQLGDLTNAVAGAIKIFMTAPELKDWIEELAAGVKDLAHNLTNDKFHKDVHKFVHDISELAKGVKRGLQWLGVIPDPSTPHPGTITGQFGPATIRQAPPWWDFHSWFGSAPKPGMAPPSTSTPWGNHPFSWMWGKITGSAPTGSADVNAAFAASGLPPEAQAFMRDIASGEAQDFNTLAGGGKFSDYSIFPNWEGFLHMYQGRMVRSHGAGLFQDEPGTWAKAAAGAGLSDFSPRSQITGNWWYAQKVYADATGGRSLLDDLKGHNLDPRGQAALGTQWARGGVAGGGRYAEYLKSGTTATAMPGIKTLGSKFIFGSDTPPAGAGKPGFDWSGHESRADLARVRAAIDANKPQALQLAPDPSPQAGAVGTTGSTTLPGGGQTVIKVENNTGGSAIISASQVGAGAQ